MTKQEAIKILSDLAGYEKTMDLIQNYSVSVQDSLHMAINALSAIDTMRKIVDGDVDTIMQILKENEE